LVEPRLDIAADLLDALPHLLDLIDELLDAPGQVAHLSLEAIHADFGIDGRATAARRRRRAAIHLPLQHVEVALEAIEALRS
jgi:hypothetical protein